MKLIQIHEALKSEPYLVIWGEGIFELLDEIREIDDHGEQRTGSELTDLLRNEWASGGRSSAAFKAEGFYWIVTAGRYLNIYVAPSAQALIYLVTTWPETQVKLDVLIYLQGELET